MSPISALETAISRLALLAKEGLSLNLTVNTELIETKALPLVRAISISELSGVMEERISRAWVIATVEQPVELFVISNKIEVGYCTLILS